MADTRAVHDDSLESKAWRDGFLGNFLILVATALLAKWIFGFAGAVLALVTVGFSLSTGASHETNIELAALRNEIREMMSKATKRKPSSAKKGVYSRRRRK